ncbi:MAG TPA: aminopeptidase P family protein [Candidatus Cloacimonadota bacterium]|nr:aminopeptidase P family protein [Candidatus Cloacimonadota bacterium]HQL14956.1 aminopeptidase P family protein [Candidatus Cloacimonadota bacterium]
MNSEVTKPRRTALAGLLENGQGVIVFAQMEQEGIEKFVQDNNFLYLTGLSIPDAVFCLFKIKDRIQEMLFIQRGIPEQEVWNGKKMTREEAQKIAGIQDVGYWDEFYDRISYLCPQLDLIWSNVGNLIINRPPSYATFMLQPVRRTFPELTIKNFNILIAPMRSVKSEWELKQLQTAIDLTGQGFIDVLQQAKAGMMEYELEAILYYRMQRNGVQQWGFAPIIATGINATTLHYKQNNCQIAENDIVLLDIGASYQNYSADVTRCFPVAGKFSLRQRQVYEEVLNVQKEIIAMIKPGVGMMQLNEKTNELIQEALLRLNLITEREQFRRYYMHSISHHLGMDTHDLGARDSILTPGNVITVEPGIYIPEESLGIRIEDDILVTETGNINLCKDIPKEADELEKIRMAAIK